MPRLSFTLRDVFWLTLVVGMGVGWWIREGQCRRERTEILNAVVGDTDGKWGYGWEMLRDPVTGKVSFKKTTFFDKPVGQP